MGIATPEAIYTAANCAPAYQLNWAVSLFGTDRLPAPHTWLEPVRPVLAADGLRLLEHRTPSDRVLQFLVSTTPPTAPADLLRLLKGRLQYALRAERPKAFRRNYRLESVGSARGATVEAYVAKQLGRHPPADPRVQERLRRYQIHAPAVDLSALRYSAHGQFLVNLHLVLEHADGWGGVEEEFLRATHAMVQKVCRKKGYLLSRAGFAPTHLHLALGCGMQDAPLSVALCFLNNLAYAHGMRAVYRFGFYAGTFGNFDLGALREAQRRRGSAEA
jgi:hypothetical protein